MTIELLWYVCLFATWLLLTVANQFSWSGSQEIRRWDLFGFVPMWTFFAPQPGIHDYYVLYQDLLTSGTHGTWIEALGPRPRQIIAFLWNPYKWETKAVADLTQLLGYTQRIGEVDYRTIMLTSPYLLLLRFVLNKPRSEHVIARRFLLVRKQGHKGIVEISIAADFHPV